jgi:outer membrane protein assembly factor BamB
MNELGHVSPADGSANPGLGALTYYTGVVRPKNVRPVIDAARRVLRWSPRALLGVFVVLALTTTHGATPATAAPKPPPVPSFWGPIYPVWHIALEGIPLGPPAFDTARAYIALRDGRLAAVSLATGGLLWSTNQAVSSPPAVIDGLVMAASGETLIGLDSATGKRRWQQPLGSTCVLAPTVGATWIAVITSKPELLLIHPSDGRLLSRQTLPAAVKVPPAGNADLVVVGLTNQQVMAVSTARGSVVWTRKIGGEPLVLTLDRDRVFVGTGDAFLCALSAANGSQKWRWRTGGDVGGAVFPTDKRVYFASLDNSLVALSRSGGDLKWEYRLPSRPVGGPVLIGDTLLLATVASQVKTFAADRGTLLETVALPGRPLHQPHMIPWTGPVPPRAVILTAGGQLIAIGPSAEPPLVPLDPMPGNLVLPPESLESVEPPLVPMLYPPGRVLLPETLPPAIIKKMPTRHP